MYPAIIILPIESIYGIPAYSAKITLVTPTKEVDPSFIEFFASNSMILNHIF